MDRVVHSMVATSQNDCPVGAEYVNHVLGATYSSHFMRELLCICMCECSHMRDAMSPVSKSAFPVICFYAHFSICLVETPEIPEKTKFFTFG